MADDEDIPTEEEFSFKLSYDEDEELIESLTQAKDNGKLDSHLKNLLRLGPGDVAPRMNTVAAAAMAGQNISSMD